MMAQNHIKLASPVDTGQQEGGLSFASVEEPRLPPRLSRFPAPFDFPEKPVLQVPDVSLIVGDYHHQHQYSANNGSASSSTTLGIAGLFPSPSLPNNTPKQFVSSASTVHHRPSANNTPTNLLESSGNANNISQSNANNSSNVALNVDGLLKELQSQREVIGGIQTKLDKLVGIESKLDNLIQFQDEFLANLFRRGALVSKEVQTEAAIPVPGTADNNPSPNLSSRRTTTTSSPTMTESSSSTTPSRTSTPAGPTRNQQQQQQQQQHQHNNQHHHHNHHKNNHSKRGGGPLARILNQEMKSGGGGNHQDSLSAIQLPSITLNEPSALFSEASGIKSLQLQEFHDDSFNSGSGADSPVLNASAYRSGSSSSHCSDDDDEEDASSPVIKIQNPGGGCGSGGRNVNNNNNAQVHTPRPSSSSSSSSSSSGKENMFQMQGLCPKEPMKPKAEDEVVLKTKQYLETLGVRFNSPTPGNHINKPTPNRNNYMIQQNVYNSIYIPTVNCAPVVPETFPTSGTGSNFHSLAQKYANPDELREFDAMKASGNTGTETTLYGMTASNLSFATKDYLQRYGLVTGTESQLQNQNHPSPPAPPPSQTPNRNFNANPNIQPQPAPPPHRHRHHRTKPPPVMSTREKDRILNMTAIKNQPKLF